MSFSKKIRISICFAFIISIIFSICSFAKTSSNIREEVLRLHVIANSDTSVDQNLKLKIRDVILKVGEEIFDGSVNVENAVKKITPQIPFLEEIAENTAKEYGFDYDVKVLINKEYFTTRTYENVTLPAGEYLALRVVIGAGEGHNWWCVMFPPMCLPAAQKDKEIASVLNYEETKLVESNPKYEPRFKILEIYEKIRSSISNH